MDLNARIRQYDYIHILLKDLSVYRSADTLTWGSFIMMYDTSLQVGLAISAKNFPAKKE